MKLPYLLFGIVFTLSGLSLRAFTEPELIQRGLANLQAGNARSAFEVLTTNSPFASFMTRNKFVNTMEELRKEHGSLLTIEKVTEVPVSDSYGIVFYLLGYETGVAFIQLDIYLSRTQPLVLGMDVSEDPRDILPADFLQNLPRGQYKEQVIKLKPAP